MNKSRGRSEKERTGAALRAAAVIGALVLLVLFSGCSDRGKHILSRLMATQASQYEDEEISEEKVKELERHVKLFSEEVAELVKKKGKLGIYYRMLGMEYMNREMYGPAFETFLKALEIYPANHIIHYYTGLASSRLAETKPEEQERREVLESSAHYYEKAIELKGNYVEALYALSMLYIFELDRPYDAEKHLEKILSVKSDHYRAMFLLARIRVEQNRIEEAVEIYNEIGEKAKEQEMVDRARENRERLMRGDYDL